MPIFTLTTFVNLSSPTLIQIEESRATFNALQTDFQTLKHTHEAIQQDLTSARDALRLRSDELAAVNAQLQRTTYELGKAQEELRDLRQTCQTSEDNLRKEMENHQCTKQMLEQERRDLNAVIGEKESQLRKCQEGLVGYERRLLSMNAYVSLSFLCIRSCHAHQRVRFGCTARDVFTYDIWIRLNGSSISQRPLL